MRVTVLGAAMLMLGACGGGTEGSPIAPSAPPSAVVITGQTVGVLDGKAVQGTTVAVEGVPPVVSDGNGFFVVEAHASGRYRSTLSGAAVVDRQTTLSVPGTNMQVSLIPRTFDLAAFDQMFRTSGSHLQRWTQAPALVVVATELAFASLTENRSVASGQRVSDADVSGIVADLAWGLPQMTGGAFSSFASVAQEAPAAGSAVNMQRDGTIVVARYQGLRAATGYVGFGRWAAQSDGTVTGGVAMFDAEFDRGAHTDTRVLHVHEMGHALGYSHVLSRASIMNAAPAPGPNAFDLDAARVAFQRAPGNGSPDVDPNITATTTSAGTPRWGPAIP